MNGIEVGKDMVEDIENVEESVRGRAYHSGREDVDLLCLRGKLNGTGESE